MTLRTRSAIFVLLAAASWGTIGLFTSVLRNQGLVNFEIILIRLGGAAVLLGLYGLLCNRKLFYIRFKDLWCFFGTGVLSYVVMNYCYFSCSEISGWSVAAILLYTAPCFVLLLSAFLFKEPLSFRKIVSLITAFLGCALVSGLGSSLTFSLKGLLLGLGSGIAYALYSIFDRYALHRDYTPIGAVFWTLLFAGFGSLPFCNLSHLKTVFSLQTVLPGLGILVICALLPLLLYTKGLEGLDNGSASIDATLEPVVCTLLSVLVLHESLSFLQVLGILLVLLAVCFLALKKSS